ALLRLVATGFDRRIPTASAPFEGTAADESGNLRKVCVKPLRQGVANCGLTLAAEVIGAGVARLLGVPVPSINLVRIDQSLIDSTGGQLADVIPGWAVASDW